MLIDDPVYGRFNLAEPVLLQLIGSAPMQRLRGVSQGGILKGAISNEGRFSRYDHSLGVMLLLRKLGASVEEQVAGLIHDSSHTAFSHVADWAFGDPTKSDLQDKALEQYVKRSELGAIILRNGMDLDAISVMEASTRFGLLERPAPDLCADRLDYTLRDGVLTLGLDVKKCINGLTVHNDEILFNSKASARAFADLYVRCQAEIWMAPENMLRYHLLADALKAAAKKGILTHEQMYGTDDQVVELLRESGDAEVCRMLDAAGGPVRFVASENGKIELKGKIRYVDPKFMEGGKAVKLSSADAGYKQLLESELKRMSQPIWVTLL